MGKMTASSPNSNVARLPETVDSSSDEDNLESTAERFVVHECFPASYSKYTNIATLRRDLVVEAEAEDDIEEGGNEYQLLPTGNDDEQIEFGYSTFDGENFQTTTSDSYQQLAETCENKATEPSPNVSQDSIPMDVKQVELIKNIMSNISLPPAVIPEWVESVAVDELKNLIIEKKEEKANKNWANFD